MLYMVTFTINIPQMLAYIPYMDPMSYEWHVASELPKPSSADHSVRRNDNIFRFLWAAWSSNSAENIHYPKQQHLSESPVLDHFH